MRPHKCQLQLNCISCLEVMEPEDRFLNSSVGKTRIYRPNTTSIPERINRNFAWDSFPTRSVSRDLSRVIIWETLATDSFDRPVSRVQDARFLGRPPISSCLSAAHIQQWQFGCDSERRPAPPRLAAETQGRSRLARRDRPTRHRRARSPLAALEYSPRRCSRKFVGFTADLLCRRDP